MDSYNDHVSLNIFYCQIFIQQWGWVTSSHILSYDPSPDHVQDMLTLRNIKKKKKQQKKNEMAIYLFENEWSMVIFCYHCRNLPSMVVGIQSQL